ncbi:hypothetical protein A5784_30720 [Mycobacterium sp. 852013-50091_SCH5140682]|uniref:hypothetical protein n=1 Tax=Mycobacterium sp. 852013-50091_SCH5140682 TaxID=1834109 RepID=UPI0007EBA75C|nr:hypothetical protein [Mycobacterium sp. 852013-50091_SCH5140682]OBC14078.1 hypothetical protein A5784_30720 [Mycobacterium sp. 852013-50091_SCH5140682]
MSDLDLDELENSTRGLVYISDGTRASEKLGRIVDAHRPLIAEVRRLRPVRIDTVEQLDALPDGVVIVDDAECAWQRNGKSYLGTRSWWAAGSEIEELSSDIRLPAHVIHTPQAPQSTEGNHHA